MITLDLARAHIDEMHRIAAAHRAVRRTSTLSRLLSRYLRHG